MAAKAGEGPSQRGGDELSNPAVAVVESNLILEALRTKNTPQ
jgi:hypothetical protein